MPEDTQRMPGPAAGPGASRADPPPSGNQAVGYRVVLPPGWSQIPVRSGTREAIKRIVDKTFAQPPDGVSRDQLTPYRIELERRLSAAAAQARRNGGVHLYLPVTLRHGAPIAASFVVSEGSLGSLEDISPDMVVSALAAEEAAAGGDGDGTVTVDGVRSLRREHTAPQDPGQEEIGSGSRRVDYVIPVPGQQDRWLLIAFSTLGGGDPDDQFARILVDLFDAIMSTFQWSGTGSAARDGGPRD
ncbi:MAG: hypothetical protein LBI49_14455 [Nocardiopsaceae bacterium]|jgi:hypothetical protein|nr:hypothetical protein [Nocardiopsaceae bacterium]